MTQASRSIEILAPARTVYEVLTDYDRYVDFFPPMRRSRLLSHQGPEAVADFELRLFNLTIQYTLLLTEEPFRSIRWRLKESNWLTRVDGGWTLEALGKSRTLATYRQSLSVKGFLPRIVASKLVEVHLPDMLQHVKQHIEQH